MNQTHREDIAPDEQRLAALRRELVESLQQRRALTDRRVAEAFDAVPRHHFLPGLPPEQVYSDAAIVTKERDGVAISSSSQPAMMAIMLQQLDLEPGQRVLEIGAGTGYNAALIRELVGPSGRVVTVDLDGDLVDGARAHLAAAGIAGVRVELGDGALGWPDAAPYDRIILTVGAADVLPAWVEQLRPGGLLVLPLAFWLNVGQFSAALLKLPDGTLLSESLAPCGFIALRGPFAGALRTVEAGEWVVTLREGPRLAADRVPALLASPRREESPPDDLLDALFSFAFQSEPLVHVLPAQAPVNVTEFRRGLLDTSAMSGCLVTLRHLDDTEGVSPVAVLYGSRAAYERLLAHLDWWRALGSPRLDDLRVLVYPRHGPITPPAGPTLLKEHATLVLAGRDGRPLPPA